MRFYYYLKSLIFSAALFSLLFLGACINDTSVESLPINSTSIIPASYAGRPSVLLGEISTINRSISISVYDHNIIDGDIITVVVNGREVISEQELRSLDNPITVNVELDYIGYNYILLFAHNEGNLGLNTCAIEIEDGLNKMPFILSADLRTNGVFDLYVTP